MAIIRKIDRSEASINKIILKKQEVFPVLFKYVHILRNQHSYFPQIIFPKSSNSCFKLTENQLITSNYI